MLFFKCMIALFSPVYRRGEGIKWGLASYTVIMFSLVTVFTATTLHVLSISYIDNRNFPYGPYYYLAMSSRTIGLAFRITFRLNNWLADGLLVSPCLIPSLVQVPNVHSILALPVLLILLHTPLGRRLPLPSLLRLRGYVFEPSTNGGNAQAS